MRKIKHINLPSCQRKTATPSVKVYRAMLYKRDSQLV